MYFALTMLSTVGYGDLTPQHMLEQALSVLLMLLGVGIFSWITSELRNVMLLSGRHPTDRDLELSEWLLELDRFPGIIRGSMSDEIELELAHYWQSDRKSALRQQLPFKVRKALKGGKSPYLAAKPIFNRNKRVPAIVDVPDSSALPFNIKKKIVGVLMYPDIGQHFTEGHTVNLDFLYKLFCGLKPRLYKEASAEDSIIIEEDSFVDEFLLI